MSKINQLINSWGMSLDDILMEGTFSGTCAAICVNPECDYTTDMEPDQDAGWCEICHTNTVQSALILMGMI